MRRLTFRKMHGLGNDFVVLDRRCDDIAIDGVILNRVGSERHEGLIAPAMARRRLPVLGALLRGKDIALPERHLGLVQASESGGSADGSSSPKTARRSTSAAMGPRCSRPSRRARRTSWRRPA